MRLLVDARFGWGHGIGRVVANTIPAIAAAHADWQIHVLVGESDVSAATSAFSGNPGVTVVPCAIKGFSLREQTGLEQYARGHDLTWFTNYWVPLRWRSPFVATVHDLLHLMPNLLPASLPKRMLARRTFAKVRRDARAVIFVSRFTQRTFDAMVGAPMVGVVVPLGGDHLAYPPARPVRARARRLIVVAQAKQHKNFALLLQAWRAATVPPHWRLTIVTPDDSMLRSSIDLAALAQHAGAVEVRQGIGNDELVALYADSAVLLMPSRYEGFGLPLLEGMRAGTLCVSASAGAMVEVAQGAFVTFVGPDDLVGWSRAIEQTCALVDSDDLDLDPLTAHNAAHAARFRWSDTAAAIGAVLRRAAESTEEADVMPLADGADA